LLSCQALVSAELALKSMSLRRRFPPFYLRRIQKLELLLLPHYRFEVEVRHGRGETKVVTAVEAVEGTVATMVAGAQLGPEPAGERLPVVLSEAEARARIYSDYRWVMLAAGIKRKRSFTLAAVP
jgi:hypothetical protein